MRIYYYIGDTRIAMRLYEGETSTLYWLLGDHLGSQSITANADGSFHSEVRYSAFGETRYTSQTDTPTDYLYTGQRIEEEAGLYYYHARFYDPYLNRWIQPDTTVPDPYNLQDWDRYSYIRNDPINGLDPSGHMRIESETCYGTGCNYTGPRYFPGGYTDKDRAINLINYYIKQKEKGTTVNWNGLHKADQEIFEKAGINEGVYKDATQTSITKSDTLHDPLTYLTVLVGGTGIIKAGITYLLPLLLPGSQQGQYLGEMYRSSTGTADSLTPRPGRDDISGGGLSFWNNPDALNPGKYVIVDSNKLQQLKATLDNNPAGHITVSPRTLQELQAWASTRNTGSVHPFTQELLMR